METYLDIIPEELLHEMGYHLEYRDLINLQIKSKIFWQNKVRRDYPNSIVINKRPQMIKFVGKVFSDIPLYYGEAEDQFTTIAPANPERWAHRGRSCQSTPLELIFRVIYGLGLSDRFPEVESWNIYQEFFYLITKGYISPYEQYTMDEIHVYYKMYRLHNLGMPKQEFCETIKSMVENNVF